MTEVAHPGCCGDMADRTLKGTTVVAHETEVRGGLQESQTRLPLIMRTLMADGASHLRSHVDVGSRDNVGVTIETGQIFGICPHAGRG